MLTSSAKAKGRNLQNIVVEYVRKLVSPPCEPSDVKSTPLGTQGPDVWLSGCAKELFPFQVECKVRAKMALSGWWEQAVGHCEGRDKPLLVVRWDRGEPLAVMKLEDLFDLL